MLAYHISFNRITLDRKLRNHIVVSGMHVEFTFRNVLVDLYFSPGSLLDHGDDFTATANDLSYINDNKVIRVRIHLSRIEMIR